MGGQMCGGDGEGPLITAGGARRKKDIKKSTYRYENSPMATTWAKAAHTRLPEEPRGRSQTAVGKLRTVGSGSGFTRN